MALTAEGLGRKLLNEVEEVSLGDVRLQNHHMTWESAESDFHSFPV